MTTRHGGGPRTVAPARTQDTGDTEQPVDYRGLFDAGPTPYLVLTPDLVIREVNRAYLEATGRRREDLLGRFVFDAFPDNPDDPQADGVRNLGASLRRALATGRPDSMALQRYDIPVAGGGFEERWWTPINTPVLRDDGAVAYVIHRVEDATDYVRVHHLDGSDDAAAGGADGAAATARATDLEVDLIAAARRLQDLNEQLRRAHAREHEVAARLQRAMLPARVAPAVRHQVATRYLPAETGPLQVCGDWFDLTTLGAARLGVSVGDVVGHGLPAAAVMGQLRSAATTATLSVERPGTALDLLDRYARTLDSAEMTTVVQAVIDADARCVTYSCAGHPPPLLVHPGGEVEVLDRAHGVPLAAPWDDPGARPEDTVACAPGDTLVLYTDGLVERRGEVLDVGLARLADLLASHAALDPESLADVVLGELVGAAGADDDTALVVVRV